MEQYVETPKSTFLGTFLKNLIILVFFVVLGGTGGWLLASQQPTLWRASAQFDQPTAVELNNYYSLATTYALVQNGSNDLDKPLTDKAFAEFKRNLQSLDLLKAFVAQSEHLKKQADAKGWSLGKATDAFLQGVSFDEKSAKLHLTLDSAEDSQKLLNELIQYATLQTRLGLNQELIEKWKVLFQQVKTAAETNLGAIQVGSQVAQQDWNGKLKVMQSVQPLDNKLQAYRLLSSPELPQQPHSPNKLLWAMIGTLIGLAFGLFGVSLFAISRRKSAV